MIRCPRCLGRKMMSALIDGPAVEGMAALTCDQCEGEGEVPDEMMQWMKDGNLMRARRIHSPDGYRTLVEESERRGIPLVDLSRMERGAIKPIMETEPSTTKPKS